MMIMNRKWLCLLGIVASTAMAGAQHRWLTDADRSLATDGMVTDFPLPNPGSGPTTIAIAQDGTLWFTESSGNRIGRMSPDGSNLKEFPLPNANSSPRIIALGSDGNMWFSEHTGNRMGRIAPDGSIAEFPIPTPNSMPRAIALGADGNIWFGEFAGGKIGRITPQGSISEFQIPTPDSGPRALAAGPDGNIWFSEFNASKIGRITPQGAITEFELPRPNSGPGDITAGGDGSMWFVELAGRMDNRQPDGNRVGRITMDGKISEFQIPAEAGTPSPINIAVGPDRNIWFTKGPMLVRVMGNGAMTAFPLSGVNAGGTGLTAGSDRQPPRRLSNRLWVAQSGGNRISFLAFR
jgi:streptogramin lyase